MVKGKSGLEGFHGFLRGEPAPDHGSGELRAHDVVVVEEPADRIAAGEEPRNRLIFAVQNLAVFADLRAAEGAVMPPWKANAMKGPFSMSRGCSSVLGGVS